MHGVFELRGLDTGNIIRATVGAACVCAVSRTQCAAAVKLRLSHEQCMRCCQAQLGNAAEVTALLSCAMNWHCLTHHTAAGVSSVQPLPLVHCLPAGACLCSDTHGTATERPRHCLRLCYAACFGICLGEQHSRQWQPAHGPWPGQFCQSAIAQWAAHLSAEDALFEQQTAWHCNRANFPAAAGSYCRPHFGP